MSEDRRFPCAHCGAECTGAHSCSECTGRPLCEKCYRESVAMVPVRGDDSDRMVSAGELATQRRRKRFLGLPGGRRWSR